MTYSEKCLPTGSCLTHTMCTWNYFILLSFENGSHGIYIPEISENVSFSSSLLHHFLPLFVIKLLPSAGCSPQDEVSYAVLTVACFVSFGATHPTSQSEFWHTHYCLGWTCWNMLYTCQRCKPNPWLLLCIIFNRLRCHQHCHRRHGHH